jgi:hypothetical protein
MDLTGMRFGKLTALNFTRKEKDKHFFWNCKCDCGKTITVSSSHLKSGHTRSCGCLYAEFFKTNKFGKKHGLYNGQQIGILRHCLFSPHNFLQLKFREIIF